MKKLLVLLLIPIISFGQDENPLNYLYPKEDLIINIMIVGEEIIIKN